MRTIDQLERVTTLEDDALLVANNAAATSTNSVKFSDVANQILSGNAASATKATSADSATSAEKATNDVNGDAIDTTYAKLNSPTFTGAPLVPTPSDASVDTQAANKKYVNDTIAAAKSAITGGKVAEATKADSADTATKADSATSATNDSLGNEIDTTYVKDVSYSGKTVTVTKGDGKSSTFDTKDTTYTEFTGATSTGAGSNGLVPAPSSAQVDDVLGAKGEWVDPKTIKVNNATKADSADTATKADSATSATNDPDGNPIGTTYAKIASPAFTGTPTVPTPGDTSADTQIANKKFVIDSITSAIGKITQFATSVVSSLPATGAANTIYFVPSAVSQDENTYEEHMYINGKWEHIGSTNIDLTGFYNDFEITGTGNAITGVSASGNKMTFNKGANYLTAHPAVSTSATTDTKTATAGGTITLISSVSLDSNGHVTKMNTSTVTLPSAMKANGIVDGTDMDFGDEDA